MAHFAELDANNVVLQVLVVRNEDILDENGVESEAIGVQRCKDLFGGVDWKQTSYNGNFRKRYAGIGDVYNKELDAFIAPKLYESWILNLETGKWEAPIPIPQDDNHYSWDEETKSWVGYKP